jgi:hypothetical protein
VARLIIRLRLWWEQHHEAVLAAAFVLAVAALYLAQSWIDEHERLARIDRMLAEKSREVADLHVQLQLRDATCGSATPLFWIVEADSPRRVFDKMTLAVQAMDVARTESWVPYNDEATP